MQDTKSMQLKILGMLLSFLLAVTFSSAVLAAGSYPTKPVRIIAPEPPGGGSDTTARIIAPKLTERLGSQVIVDNRGGAGGVIGAEVVAKAVPDGYTLLLVSGKHTIQAVLEKLPYDAIKSFTPIARLGGGPSSLCVNPNVPANSVKELIALAKQKPGKLIFATAGLATTPHMSSELFKIMADIDFKIVHFKGAGPAIIDLLGGHSDALIGNMLVSIPHIKTGKLKILGTAGVRRSAILPDVPTIGEAGVPGFSATNWFGILAPAGTPKPIADRLSKEIKAVLDSDAIKKQFLTGAMEADYLGPSEFGTFIGEEVDRWASVVKKANIKLD